MERGGDAENESGTSMVYRPTVAIQRFGLVRKVVVLLFLPSPSPLVLRVKAEVLRIVLLTTHTVLVRSVRSGLAKTTYS